MRKKYLIISAVVAVVILVSATIGVALAQTGTSAATSTTQVSNAVAGFSDNLTARVAKILGIDQNKLQAAINQANTELQNERIDNTLNQLVADGKITADQAKQYKTWLNSNPNTTPDQSKKYQDWLNSRPDIQVPGLPGLDMQGGGRGSRPDNGFGMPIPPNQ